MLSSNKNKVYKGQKLLFFQKYKYKKLYKAIFICLMLKAFNYISILQ